MSALTRPDLLPKTLDEALGRLVEEMHEAGVEIGHIMRFGRVARDNASGKIYDNAFALRKELNDLKDAIQRYEEFDNSYLNEMRFQPKPIDHGNVNIQLDDSDYGALNRPYGCKHPMTVCMYPQCNCFKE